MGNDQSTSGDRNQKQNEYERFVKEQKELYERLSQSRRSTASGSTQPQAECGQNKSSTQTTSFERQRAPYNFNSTDLPSTSNITRTSNNANLRTTTNNQTGNASTTNVSEFVFVTNNNASRSATPSTSLRTSASYVPSAPPASSVVSPQKLAVRTQSPARSRERSVNRNPRRGNDNELNCPTCNNTFTLQIFQCKNGHSSCDNCKARGVNCGICGLLITQMRNITLEAYIAERVVPCPNAESGCCLQLPIADINTHKKECPFGIMDCPMKTIFGNCNWKGKLQQMTTHFNNFHPTNTLADVDTELNLSNIRGEYNSIQLIVLGTFHFLFHIKVSERDNNIYMAAQLLGTGVSAAKWSYEIHVYKKSEPRRKYEYKDVCNGGNVTANDIFKASNCAVLPLPYAMTFFNNGQLTYKFYIKKDVDNKKKFSRHKRGGGNASQWTS